MDKYKKLSCWLKLFWEKYGYGKTAVFYKNNFYFMLESLLSENNIKYNLLEMTESSHDDFKSIISKENVILFSSIPKENIILGNYEKYGRDNLDVFIFSDFYSSELESLSQRTNVNLQDCSDEWVAKEQEQYKILSSDPIKNQAWLRYTKNQKETIIRHFIKYDKNAHKRAFKILPQL
jgi:hypothetical protein